MYSVHTSGNALKVGSTTKKLQKKIHKQHQCLKSSLVTAKHQPTSQAAAPIYVFFVVKFTYIHSYHIYKHTTLYNIQYISLLKIKKYVVFRITYNVYT